MTNAEFKMWRAARGWTQAKTGEIFGVARETVVRWENGREIPTYVGIICGLHDEIARAALKALEAE